MVLTANMIIPPSTDAAVWLAIEGCETYADFRTTLRGCTRYLIDHRVGNAKRAHLVARDQADRHPRESPEPSLRGFEWEAIPAAEDFPDGMFGNAEARDNFVLVMSRFAQRRQRQTDTGARKGQPLIRTATPPRDAKDAKCANCIRQGTLHSNARAQSSPLTSAVATRATSQVTYRGSAQTRIRQPGQM